MTTTIDASDPLTACAAPCFYRHGVNFPESKLE